MSDTDFKNTTLLDGIAESISNAGYCGRRYSNVVCMSVCRDQFTPTTPTRRNSTAESRRSLRCELAAVTLVQPANTLDQNEMPP